MTGTRAARVAICLVLGLAAFSMFAGTALGAEDDGELVDVSKTVEDLDKELVKLREHGRWAREGELSAASSPHTAAATTRPRRSSRPGATAAPTSRPRRGTSSRPRAGR